MNIAVNRTCQRVENIAEMKKGAKLAKQKKKN